MAVLVVSVFAVLLAVSCYGNPVGRVVNGTNADISKYPYMVSLLFNGRLTCGGTILDEYNVLTAGHCSVREVGSYSVRYGSTLSTLGDTISVESIAVHERFTGLMPIYNDVAVHHLSSPLPLGENVQPITLPEPFAPTPENARAVLTGWGREQSGGTVQDILQEVDIIVYPDDQCEFLHKFTGPTDRDFNVCAGVPEGGKGQCNGDSGGPLVVDGVEIGIVSWSVKPCTIEGYPGVYTKVSNYVNWIRSNLKTV